MQGLFLNMPVVHTLAITAISTAVSFGIITASGYLAHKIGKIAEIATFEDVAILQLEELSIKLNKQNIKTNVKLLLESEMYHEEYKFTLSKNNVPGIMQRKFCFEENKNTSKIEQIPYLTDAFDKLNQNAIETGSYDDSIIQKIWKEFGSNFSLKKIQLKVTLKRLERNNFNQLNEK